MNAVNPASDNLSFNDTALAVLKERYLHIDPSTGKQETPRQMLERVARVVSKGDTEKFHAYYDIMASLDFLPNSPTLMNAGREGVHGQLSACFVLDVPDSMAGIFDALKYQALIHKSGGGTGFNFSKLRAKGAKVNSTNGMASGPVSFMELFDMSTEKVMQGGMRRGANMGILNVDHPDIMEFIHCKSSNEHSLKNFNISVGITDEFMMKIVQLKTGVCAGSMSEAQFNVLVEANTIWSAICHCAWRSGDPGVIFLDAIERDNPTPEYGKLDATNPCGEQPLLPFEACNLGSLNLSNFVREDGDENDPNTYFKGRYVDFSALADAVKVAVEFLNDVIDVNHYPLPEIEAAVKRTCKIGLGVMGWADMLFKLGVRYGSKQSYDLARIVMGFISNRAREASAGRNASVLCVAPTGTISLLAGCSSGIEPVFALKHKRVAFANDVDEHGNSKRQVFDVFNPEYEAALKANDSRIASGVFVTAQQIAPLDHVKMQAAFQLFVDAAISKTVNLPHDATVEDISEVYVEAWRRGCKGVTVYRDGCKLVQVLYAKDEDKEKCPECGSTDIVHESGCKRCDACGWSPCSV